MKASLFFLAIPALVSAAKCNADNCARALTGTVNGPAQPSSRINTDCSSFQLKTAYPAATTTTITSGSTSTTILPETTEIVVAPSVLPAYAKTACTASGIASARFASACSCAGVTETTSTAPVPTATVVVPTGNSFRGPSCSAPGTQPGPDAGGCSEGCTCDSRAGSSTIGLCDADNGLCRTATRCSSDADCAADEACGGTSQVNHCGFAICFNYNGCSSSYTPTKRSLLEGSVSNIGSMAVPLVKKDGRFTGKREDLLYAKFQPGQGQGQGQGQA